MRDHLAGDSHWLLRVSTVQWGGGGDLLGDVQNLCESVFIGARPVKDRTFTLHLRCLEAVRRNSAL